MTAQFEEIVNYTSFAILQPLPCHQHSMFLSTKHNKLFLSIVETSLPILPEANKTESPWDFTGRFPNNTGTILVTLILER